MTYPIVGRNSKLCLLVFGTFWDHVRGIMVRLDVERREKENELEDTL